MGNINQSLQEGSNGQVHRSEWRADYALSRFLLAFLEAPDFCGTVGTTQSDSNHGSRQSALRRIRNGFRPSQIAAYAIVVFVISIPLSSIQAQTTPQREGTEPVQLTKGGEEWVATTLRSLSLEEKVGQMIMDRCFLDYSSFNSHDYKKLRNDLQKYHIGSLVIAEHINQKGLVRPSPLETAKVTNQLQSDSKLPLLLAADLERGLASRLKGVPDFPWPMAFGAVGDPAEAERMGATTAREARTLGIEWALSPVADVNDNPANPVINDRSFGEDSSSVGTLVSAFIRGAHQNGLLVTAKHFPGLGNSTVDPRYGIATINADINHLNAVELLPFREAIESGVDAIMVEHTFVPALDPDPSKFATISQKIVGGLLEKDMGFKGVVLTDLIEKQEMARLYGHTKGNPAAEAAIDAIKAGCDVIMVTNDLGDVDHAILKAVQSGEIPESRIDDSVSKILTLKAKLGLYRERVVEINQVAKLAQGPEDFEFAQQVADRAVTLVRDQGKILPIAKTGLQTNEQTNKKLKTGPRAHAVVVVLAENLEDIDTRAFEEAFKARCPAAKFFYFDGQSPGSFPNPILSAVAHAPRIVVAAYITHSEVQHVVINGKHITIFGLLGPSGELLKRILNEAADRTAVVSLGSPYLIENYPWIQTYICTYAIASTSQISAVKALFGEIQNDAKLPVTLPGIAPRGFSVSWPTQVGAAGAK